MLVYRREPALIMDYEKHEGSIMKRLLEIIKKISQLKEVARKVIWKSQAKLDKKFKKIKIQVF